MPRRSATVVTFVVASRCGSAGCHRFDVELVLRSPPVGLMIVAGYRNIDTVAGSFVGYGSRSTGW